MVKLIGFRRPFAKRQMEGVEAWQVEKRRRCRGKMTGQKPPIRGWHPCSSIAKILHASQNLVLLHGDPLQFFHLFLGEPLAFCVFPCGVGLRGLLFGGCELGFLGASETYGGERDGRGEDGLMVGGRIGEVSIPGPKV